MALRFALVDRNPLEKSLVFFHFPEIPVLHWWDTKMEEVIRGMCLIGRGCLYGELWYFVVIFGLVDQLSSFDSCNI